MMSSICQAMTSVSGGVAAFTAENDVAIVVVMAAARANFVKRFIWWLPSLARMRPRG